jgi:hypothetical protein
MLTADIHDPYIASYTPCVKCVSRPVFKEGLGEILRNINEINCFPLTLALSLKGEGRLDASHPPSREREDNVASLHGRGKITWSSFFSKGGVERYK